MLLKSLYPTQDLLLLYNAVVAVFGKAFLEVRDCSERPETRKIDRKTLY
jgi:hypothetical protein